jgi:hypothetical protein
LSLYLLNDLKTFLEQINVLRENKQKKTFKKTLTPNWNKRKLSTLSASIKEK